MASADYRLCDRCGAKAFYDASLNYEEGPSGEDRLDQLGDWRVICVRCARTHRTTIVPREGAPCDICREAPALAEAGYDDYHGCDGGGGDDHPPPGDRPLCEHCAWLEHYDPHPDLKTDTERRLLAVVKLAYIKQQRPWSEAIGWEELGDRLCDEICNAIGNEDFCEWVEGALPLLEDPQ